MWKPLPSGAVVVNANESEELLRSLLFGVERTHRLIEDGVLPELRRIADALESRAPRATARPRAPASTSPSAAVVLQVRDALAAGRFDEADALYATLVRDHPDSDEARTLPGEIATARAELVDDLRAQIEASRSASDPDTVLSLHDALAPLLEPEALVELNLQLVRWMLGLIMRRMRSGTVRGDVVRLAARVADRFGATTEGASLKASLPMLRRSAGLCTKCGEPYAGLAESCPRCVAAAVATGENRSSAPSQPVDEADDEIDPADGEAESEFDPFRFE